MEEIWKDIEGFEGLYQVSNFGRVKKLAQVSRRLNRWGTITEYHQAEKILTPAFDGRKHYLFVGLNKGEQRTLRNIHRLVAEAFIPNPNNLPMINHKDEDKTNNHVDNLEWCSAQYNNTYNNIHYRTKEKRRKAVIQMTLDDEFVAEYESVREAERQTGFRSSSISAACRGEKKTKQSYGFHWKYKEE